MPAIKPQQQHIVPKCYLKQFVDPSTPDNQGPYVWQFDKEGKNRRRRAPKSLFKEIDFYTLDLPGGGRSNIVEESLSKLESRYAVIFRNKIRKHLPLNDKEHIFVCAFTYAMLFRTKPVRQSIDSFVDLVLKKVEDLEQAHGATSRTGNELRASMGSLHSKSLIGNLAHVVPVLARMNLAFLCTPKIGARFISSDNPCFMFNPDLQWLRGLGGPGLTQPNVQVTLPLSPEITLCMTWHNTKGYVRQSNKQVNDLNRMIRAHSHEFIVSNAPKTKLIWFSPVPLDALFLIKILCKYVQNYFLRLKWRFKGL